MEKTSTKYLNSLMEKQMYSLMAVANVKAKTSSPSTPAVFILYLFVCFLSLSPDPHPAVLNPKTNPTET